MNMSSFVELANYLDSILVRTKANCKKHDVTGIQYMGNNLLTVTINEEAISSNIDKIFIYNSGDTINLLLLTLHLVKHKFAIGDIETITIE